MTFSSISDIHVKDPTDDRYRLLIKFMKSKLVCDSDQIFLLGDIFDLAIGGHPEYYEVYKEFFDLMIEHTKAGKIIRYFEGNHDFHLEGFFNYLKRAKGLINFHYYKTNYQEKIDDKVFIFAHGDDIELDNPSYKAYKNFINNSFMKLIMDELFTFQFIQNLGQYLSKKSRARNSDKYENPESQDMIREKYRRSVRFLYQYRKFDYFIGGHSHVREELQTKYYEYYNCGFVPVTKMFIHYDGAKIQSIEL